MNYFKKKCLVLEWFYHWIDQGQTYENAFSQVIHCLNREDKIDGIIYPIVMAERFARNYKELSPEMISCIKNAIEQFDELPKKSFDFTSEDFDEFNSDVNEAKALIAYVNKLYN